ncbi:MAG TPA: hypothetical protein VFC24_12110 [Casimicrobiaceae bacterium]|nr:hypothetical protein [Casimicrobiaceae bacterium]
MSRKLLIAWIVTFVLWMAGSYIVHGVMLHDDYARLAGLFRPEADAQKFMPLMLLAHVIMSGAFVWIYSRGVDAGPWLGQGVRFGIAVALLTAVPTYLIYYVVQPMPAATVVKQIIGDGIIVLVLGVVVAGLYRGPAASLRQAPA